jgi:OFA family oxalate/formate antiporter-like MFS transporter
MEPPRTNAALTLETAPSPGTPRRHHAPGRWPRRPWHQAGPAVLADAVSKRIYYGWLMLPLAVAALIASSPGQTFGVSIFNEPMRLSLGLSHGELAALYTLGTLLGALPITLFGWFMDRHGIRRAMLLAVTLFAGACLLTAVTRGWLGLLLAFWLLRMLGPGALAFVSGNTLAYWFDRRLGLVEGIRQLGMAVAMAIIPAMNLWLVASFGWRGSYAVLGTVIWCTLFPIAWLLYRNQPAELGQHIDGQTPQPLAEPQGPTIPGAAIHNDEAYWGFTLSQTLHTFAFWIVGGGNAIFSLIQTAVFFCIVPIFAERGLTDGDAAIMLTAFAISLAVTQLAGGILADHYPAPPLLCLGLAGLGAGVGLLYASHSLPVAVCAGVVLGASQGIFFGTSQPLWPRYFGRRHLGKIRGFLMTLAVGSSSLGPLLAGVTRDVQGNFDFALIVFSLTPLVMAVMALAVVPPPREAAEKVPALDGPHAAPVAASAP